MKPASTSLPFILLTGIAFSAMLAPLSAHARSLIPDQPSVEIRLEALRALRASVGAGGKLPRGNPFQTPPSAPLVASAPPAYQPPAYQPKVALPQPVAPQPATPQPPVAMVPPPPPPSAAPQPVATQPTLVKKQAAVKKPQKKALETAAGTAPQPEKPINAIPAPVKKPSVPASNDDVYQAKAKPADSLPYAPLNATLPGTKKMAKAPSKPEAPEMEMSLDDVMKTPPAPPPAQEKARSAKDKVALKKDEAIKDAPSPKNLNENKKLPEPDLGDLKFEPFTPLTDSHPSDNAQQKKSASAKKEPPLPMPSSPADTASEKPMKMAEAPLTMPPLPDKAPESLQDKKQGMKKEEADSHAKKPAKEKEPLKENAKTSLALSAPAGATPDDALPNGDKALPSLADLDALPDDTSKDALKDAPLTLAPDKVPSPVMKTPSTLNAKDKKSGKESAVAMNGMPALPNVSAPSKAGQDKNSGMPQPLMGDAPPKDSALQPLSSPNADLTPPLTPPAVEKTVKPEAAPAEAPKKEGFLPNLKSSFASFLGGKKKEDAKPVATHSVAPAIAPALPDQSATPPAGETNEAKDGSGLPALPNFASPGSPKAVPSLGATTSLPPLPAFGAGASAAKGQDKITTDEPLPPLPFGDTKNKASAASPKAPEEKQLASLGEPKTQDMGMPPLKEPSMGGGAEGSALTVLFSQSETEVPLAFQQPLINMSKELIGNDTKIKVIAYASGSEDQKSIARRISLARALAVRAFLIDLGVDNVRISVQALGNDVKKGPSERADVILLPKG